MSPSSCLRHHVAVTRSPSSRHHVAVPMSSSSCRAAFMLLSQIAAITSPRHHCHDTVIMSPPMSSCRLHRVASSCRVMSRHHVARHHVAQSRCCHLAIISMRIMPIMLVFRTSSPMSPCRGRAASFMPSADMLQHIRFTVGRGSMLGTLRAHFRCGHFWMDIFGLT